MKKILLSVSLVLISIFSGCGSKNNEPQDAKVQVIKIAFNQSDKHPQYRALSEFGKAFEDETHGKYKVEISPNELLGDQRAAAELVQNGVIQMAVVANPVVENFNKDFAVIGIPYLYDSLEHQKKVFLSGALDPLFNSVKKEGFVVIGAFTAGARSVYTNKQINKPEDLKGYKIRTMQSETMKKMLDDMGGVGTPMPQGEVYTAVQQGVIEGGENNEVTYADLKHYEVSPYYSYTNHLMIPDLIIVNEKFYEGMSEEDRNIFNTLIHKAVEREFEEWAKDVEKAKKIAEENGAKFSTLDMKPFQKNVKDLQDTVVNRSETTKEIYKKIRDLAN